MLAMTFQAFFSQFLQDVVSEPYLAVAAFLGLLTFSAGMLGTTANVKNESGGVSRFGFACVLCLFASAGGEILLTYADEKREERNFHELAASVTESTEKLFEDYAGCLEASYAAQDELLALEAGGEVNDAALAAAQEKLRGASEKLADFDRRWSDPRELGTADRKITLKPSSRFRELVGRQQRSLKNHEKLVEYKRTKSPSKRKSLIDRLRAGR